MIEKVWKLAGCGLLGLVLSLAANEQVANAQDSSSSQPQPAPAPQAQPAQETQPAPQPRTSLTTGKLAAAAPVTYDNRYEIYGGLNLQTFQAGQSLYKRMNLGGVEASGTYWVFNRLGATADFRGEAGTTPIFPNAQFNGRALVVLYTGMLGVTYRGPKTARFAVDYHAFGGVSHGDFSETGVSNTESGLYTNRTKPIAAFGGSLDFNRTKNLAIRLSPDLILEHFGSQTREFFAISGGIVYRLGKR